MMEVKKMEDQHFELQSHPTTMKVKHKRAPTEETRQEVDCQLQECLISSQHLILYFNYQILQYRFMPRKSSSSSSSNSSLSSEKPSPKISVVVSQLTVNVSEQHLFQIFRHFGIVDHIEMSKETGTPSSTAKLYFDRKQDAQRAINYMNQGFIDGAKIRVEQENIQQQIEGKREVERYDKKKDYDKQKRTEFRERRRSRSRGERKGRKSRGNNKQARYKKRERSRSSSSSKSDSSSSSSSS